MFAIGDREWPGLSKLAEECGEVGQVVGKLMGTRGQIHHWDGTNLATRLEEEMGDAKAAIDFVLTHCNLSSSAVERRRQEKNRLFEEWHQGEDPPPMPTFNPGRIMEVPPRPQVKHDGEAKCNLVGWHFADDCGATPDLEIRGY